MLHEAHTLGQQGNDPAVLSRVLVSSSYVAIQLGHLSEAMRMAQEAREIARDINDNHRMLHAINLIGDIELIHRNFNEAQQNLEEAHFMAVLAGNQERTVQLLNSLGQLALAQYDFVKAEEYFLNAIEVSYRMNVQHQIAAYVTNLGRTRIMLGRLENARHDLQEALQRASELELTPIVLQTLINYALLFDALGESERATRLVGLVQFHIAYNAQLEREATAMLNAWGKSITDAANAARSHSIESEIEALLGHP
jgi:tetratricopeptide (TPR) repeat protein